jgi:3-hydroxypropanoate dehydrogenase
MDDELRAAAEAVTALRQRIRRLDDDGLDLIFREARTFYGWSDTPVAPETLRQLYDLMIMGPTSANCLPARIVFVTSDEAKERLRPALSRSNAEKTVSAPVTAILGYDLNFFEHLPRLYPRADAKPWFTSNAALAEETAFRNGTLQGAYFIVAARALGLDTGPMSGFKNAVVDEEFFAGTAIKSNFICSIGYGVPETVIVREPRFDFDEVCQIL